MTRQLALKFIALVPSCALAVSDEKRTYALGGSCAVHTIEVYDRYVVFRKIWDSVEPFGRCTPVQGSAVELKSDA